MTRQEAVTAAATDANFAIYQAANDKMIAAQEMLEDVTGHRVIPNGAMTDALEDAFGKMMDRG